MGPKNISKLFQKLKISGIKGLFKIPILYFGLILVIFLVLIIFISEPSPKIFSVQINHLKSSQDGEKLFFSQKTDLLETPDLSIIGGNSLAKISIPQILSSKVLGAIFGQDFPEERKGVIEYIVESGDTLSSIAKKYNLSSLDTLRWANPDLKGDKIAVNQKLVILPVDGVIHHVKSGDTVSDIAKTYKAKSEEIISFNEVELDKDGNPLIYIGDTLIVPNGVMPKKVPAVVQAPVGSSYFMFPTEGKISQGLHWYNAVDVANSCGTPVYAAASGTVLKVKMTTSRSKWAFSGMGNHLAILHSNGVVTYYGHILTSFVSPGEPVSKGDRIAFMGGEPGTPGAGLTTGCHLHFGVSGAKNPLEKYPLHSEINIK